MVLYQYKIIKGMDNYMSNKSSKIKVKECNRFLFAVLCGILQVFFRLVGIRITTVNKCDHLPLSPSIVLCNHGSFFDFMYAGLLLKKSCPHFIIARLYFYHKWLGRLLTTLGGFPKSMFAMDLESTKNSLRVLHNGGVLVMMPEARLSTAGKFEDIQPNTFSFLKKANVPVYTIKIHGSYFAKPKWGNGFRRGALVESQLDLLFTTKDLESLSVEDIKKSVVDRLYFDEFQWLQTKPHIHYRSAHLAEGLENILTICPLCKQHYTIKTKGSDIFCEHCGKLTTLDSRYSFSPDFTFNNFAQWYEWQKSVIKDQIALDPIMFILFAET